MGSPNSDRGELLSVARDRCDRAIREYHRHPGYAILPTGGFGTHFNTTDRPHAFYLREHLLAHGVPQEDILEFAESRNTVEDAALSFPIATKHGIDRAIIVTSDYHADRARYVFERAYADIALVISACPTDEATCDLDLRALVAHEKEALAKLKRQERHTSRIVHGGQDG